MEDYTCEKCGECCKDGCDCCTPGACGCVPEEKTDEETN